MSVSNLSNPNDYILYIGSLNTNSIDSVNFGGSLSIGGAKASDIYIGNPSADIFFNGNIYGITGATGSFDNLVVNNLIVNDSLVGNTGSFNTLNVNNLIGQTGSFNNLGVSGFIGNTGSFNTLNVNNLIGQTGSFNNLSLNSTGSSFFGATSIGYTGCFQETQSGYLRAILIGPQVFLSYGGCTGPTSGGTATSPLIITNTLPSAFRPPVNIVFTSTTFFSSSPSTQTTLIIYITPSGSIYMGNEFSSSPASIANLRWTFSTNININAFSIIYAIS
jgi:hypothetical protein